MPIAMMRGLPVRVSRVKDASEKRNQLFVVTRDLVRFVDAFGKIRGLSMAAPKFTGRKDTSTRTDAEPGF
jgi:hypothetical protein